MDTFHEDEMMSLANQKGPAKTAVHARLARLAMHREDKRSTLLELAIAKYKLGIATLSSRPVRSAGASFKLPLGSRLANVQAIQSVRHPS